MSTLTLFKLSSSEEILAKIKHHTAEDYIIEEAVSLIFSQDRDGQVNTGFAPFMPLSEGPIELNRSLIASKAKPNKQLAEEHLRIFSGIVLPGR